MTAVLTFMLVFVVLWLIVSPLLTLLHELGHAVAALLLSTGPMTISLGDCLGRPEQAHVRFRMGWLTVQAKLPTGVAGFYTLENWSTVGHQRLVAIILAGPLTSLLLTIVLGGGAWVVRDGPAFSSAVLFWSAVGAASLFGFTIVPWHYPSFWGPYVGRPSDGQQALELLRGAETASYSE